MWVNFVHAMNAANHYATPPTMALIAASQSPGHLEASRCLAAVSPHLLANASSLPHQRLSLGLEGLVHYITG